MMLKNDDQLSEDEKFFIKLLNETRELEINPDFDHIPPTFKKLNTKRIALPKQFDKSKKPFEDIILDRVSSREFSDTIGLEQVSKLLFFSKGFRVLMDAKEFGVLQKSNVPSAGGRHPIELYMILQRVDGIPDGIYHYDVENHALAVISQQKVPPWQLKKVFYGKSEFVDANIILFMTAVHRRTSWKYGRRAFRLIFLDAGHIGQNVYLVSEALGLGVCAVGAVNGSFVERLLRIDGKREALVYSMVVGKKRIK